MGVRVSRRDVLAAACAFACAAPLGARAERETTLNAGAVQYGTGQWLFDVIAHNKLDAAEGFNLSLRLLASKRAADIALLGQQADIVIADWFWVMRQKSLGAGYQFMPFTASLGGVIVPAASPVKDIAGLKGKEIGVAGGPIDKSWILLRAYGIKHGVGDLASTAKPVFGAPPLLNEQAALGRVAALLNFWPYAARLEAKGWRRLIAVSDIMRSFGIRPDLPLVGFVFPASLAKDEPDLMQGFARAVRKAQRILLDSDAEWDRIRPLMKAANDEEFRLLRSRYREGVPHGWDGASREDARKLFEIVRRTGGEDVTGPGVAFDPKAFWDGVVL